MKDFVDDLVALCRSFVMFERERVCCGSVTVQQCVVLQTLLSGGSEVGPLADNVRSSPSAMTRLLDGLVSRGWVERVRGVQDRRRVEVCLTSDGRAEAERLRMLTEVAVQAVLAMIPEAKRAQAIESVGLVRQAMSEAHETLPAGCG